MYTLINPFDHSGRKPLRYRTAAHTKEWSNGLIVYGGTMIYLDHLKLVISDPHEMKRVRNLLLGMERGGVLNITTMHEADNSCCKREPWNQTWQRICDALQPPTPPPHVLANRDRRENSPGL